MEERKHTVIVSIRQRSKGERRSGTLDVVREEYADYIRRVLHHAGLQAYPRRHPDEQ